MDSFDAVLALLGMILIGLDVIFRFFVYDMYTRRRHATALLSVGALLTSLALFLYLIGVGN